MKLNKKVDIFYRIKKINNNEKILKNLPLKLKRVCKPMSGLVRCLIFNFIPTVLETPLNIIILPPPQEVKLLQGTLAIKSKLCFHMENVPNIEFFKELLREELEPLAIQVEFNEVFSKNLIEEPFTFQCPNADESYRLVVHQEYAQIDALSTQGLYYGFQTFFQLLTKSDGKQLLLPQVEIFDYPTMEIRGVADDISRGQVFTVDAAKRYIREISRVKNNFFAIYIEDIFEFSAHPKIGMGRGRLTPAEVREICAYGAKYFVEIFPIFESYQHWDNILRLPDYEKYGEFPGSFNLNIGDPAIFPLIDSMYSDLVNVFPSPYFHIGGDEAFDIGRFRSREFVKKMGGIGPALAEVVGKLIEMIKAHGKTKILMYHDMIIHYEEALASLPKDLILMYWNYSPKKNAKHNKIKKLREARFNVIVSPAMINWGRNWPDIHKSWNNIIAIIKAGIKFGAIGVLNSTWGDNGNEDMRENRYWGAFLSGTLAWNPKCFDKTTFWEGFARLFYGISDGLLVKSIYHTLSTFNEHWNFVYPVRFMPLFWCHPFPALKIKPHYKRWQELKENMDYANQLITQLENKVTRNEWHIGYLKLAALLGKTLARKYATSVNISSILLKEGVNATLIPIVEKDCQEMISLYQTAKSMYEKLWLQCAKQEGLGRILTKFDLMINAYQQKLKEIKKGLKWSNPFLPSEWIYPKGARIGVDDSYFVRYTFNLNIPKDFIRRAHVQLVGNDYAILYVNGQKLGSVSSRLCISPVPRDTAVKIFDIQPYLAPGKNILGIEGRCFSVAVPAILAYGEIMLEDERAYILTTDKHWVGSSKYEKDWTLLTFDDSNWKPVRSRGRVPKFNSEINLPDFEQGIPSRLVDHFGILSFLSVTINSFVGPTLAAIIRRLLGIGMKVLGLDTYLL